MSTKSYINWIRDTNLERRLDHMYHVKWVFHDPYDLAKVNVRKSRHNQARFEKPIDAERVTQFAAQAATITLDVPALLVYKESLAEPGSRSPLDIIGDGNHRDEVARRLGLKSAAAYEILEAGPQTLATITKAENGWGGIGQTPEERLQHAVNIAMLPENAGKPTKDLAAFFGQHEKTLRAKLDIAKARATFSTDGALPVPGHRQLSDAVIGRLLRIRSNDRLLQTAAAGLARFKKLTEKTAKELVDAVLAATPKTEDRQLAVVHEWLDRLTREATPDGTMSATGKPKTTQQKVQSDLTRLHRSLATYLPDTVNARDLLTTDEQRAEAVSAATALRKYLTRLIKELAQ